MNLNNLLQYLSKKDGIMNTILSGTPGVTWRAAETTLSNPTSPINTPYIIFKLACLVNLVNIGV